MILNNVRLHVDEGEMVGLVGPNGAGKSTILRTIAGLLKWEKDSYRGTHRGKITIDGTVRFAGEDLSNVEPHEIVKKGLVLTPERGRPFREMTVLENLMLGAYLSGDNRVNQENLEKVFELFPVLKERTKQYAGTLSGGERTMLAIGRSLMSRARLLLIDEPSVGLAPKVKSEMFKRIRDVHGLGITVLMTEQDIGFAFDLSKRNYVISQGHIVAEGNPEELLADDVIKRSYLGI
jgi:branched-chain amino acid transport system ATP-binding protein